MGNRGLRVLAVTGLLASMVATAVRAEMVLGVYPYLSATQVADEYAPLPEYLAKKLGEPVTMVSARDFPTFIDRTREGAYDVIFTAPHMGRLAEVRDGWQRLAQTGFKFEIVVLVRQDSPIKTLTDLKGQSIAVGSRNSMTYQIIDHALATRSMALGRDVPIVDAATFSNVVHAVSRGEAEAGATGLNLLQAAVPAEQALVRIIYRAPPTPGFLIMANPRLGQTRIAALRAALLEFASTSAGQQYFRRSGQIDFRPIDQATMQRIDPYTAVLMERK